VVGRSLLGAVHQMVAQHNANDGLWRIVLIELLSQRKDLNTAVSRLDVGKDVPRVQINPSQGRLSVPQRTFSRAQQR